jgi:hypothetical protein
MASTELAETLALKAMAFIAADERRLSAFVALSGSGLDDLRTRADDPEMLAAVLDFLLSDEAVLLEFCDQEGLDPTEPGRARRQLPGAEYDDF